MATRMSKKTDTTKKTTTRKTTTKATTAVEPEVDEAVVEEVEIKEEVKETVTPKKVEKKVFNDTDGIKCHSVVQGGLFMEGLKTGMVYRFIDYDDTCEVEYRDLVAAVRSKSKFVFNPWIIIDDEDFIAQYPQISKFYDKQYSTRDLKAILRMDVPDMIASIKKLPSGAVDNLKTIASTQILNGTLDSVRKIKALDELFDTQLDLVSSVLNS